MKVESNPLLVILKMMDAMNVRETNILPEDGGWKFYTMDPAGVSVTTAFMKPASFPEGESLDGMICVSVPFMLDVLQPNEVCDISVKDGSIIIKYDNAKRSKRLIEPEEGHRKIPQLEGLSTCVVMSDDIINIAKQKCFDTIKTENGGVTVTMNETGLVFDATSEVESAQLSVEGTSVLEEDEEQLAIYATAVIFPVLKALPKNTVTSVMFRTDFPVQINIDNDMYSMDLFIAPMKREE